jgi:hypothetical protein
VGPILGHLCKVSSFKLQATTDTSASTSIFIEAWRTVLRKTKGGCVQKVTKLILGRDRCGVWRQLNFGRSRLETTVRAAATPQRRTASGCGPWGKASRKRLLVVDQAENRVDAHGVSGERCLLSAGVGLLGDVVATCRVGLRST